MSGSSTNTLGKYEIIREIARSNDIVYEAIDPSINRRVALKELCIPANLTGAQKRERIERFLREGRAAGKLTHPNIVTIYEVGKDGDRYFIAMEYLEGQTLRDMIQAGGAMSIRDVVNFTTQLCSALSYAHNNGIIHRDIKPDNVQVLPGAHVKLTDFGIARMMGESSITVDGQVFGTPSYMSPEQVAGKPLDTRSDIFSLGVMLYEMVTGKKPFTGDSVVTITYNIVNSEAPAPPGAPPYLAGIIRKAMSKDPNGRYSTAEEMVEDLREEKCSAGFMLDSPIGAWNAPTPFNMPGNNQQPQPPLTPYGTSIPSPGVGSVPGPFGGNAGQVLTPIPLLPPAPRTPILSAETRNFLGIFFLTVALTGMVVFAAWAINLAFSSYQTAVTSAPAMEYFDSGTKAYRDGDTDKAMLDWKNAIKTSPKSKAADSARQSIFDVSVRLAREAYDARNYATVELQAKTLIEANPNRPEGYYYMAASADMQGNIEKAKPNYARAIEKGGNDDYAQAARQRLGRIYMDEGARLESEGKTPEALQAYKNAKTYGDAQTMAEAEEKISALSQ
ncbi:MAG: protein kinase [Armatimonadetes bacterium]|nr:protein kinase [Armatimonadota bacterium]